jgi:hypothetical protein
MRLVIVESPFAGDVARNLRYLRSCMRDCLLRNEAPYASHSMYTQPGVLDDGDPEQRKLGMLAGFNWRSVARATVVYSDLGITMGMQAGIEAAQALIAEAGTHTHSIEHRSLGEGWEERAIEHEATFKTKWP